MAGPLAGLKVLDLTDEQAIYGAKLLADLGAVMVRPEPPGGDPLRSRGPFYEGISLWHVFFASNRRFVTLDSADETGFEKLWQGADIVLTSTGGFGVSDKLLASLAERPGIVHVDATSFGRTGPWKDFLAPDLVAGALGGLVATTGDVDTPPLKTFGELNFIVSGTYVAVAALAALFSRRQDGRGQRVDVSVHECIASCLEHVFMFYWYADRMGREERVITRRGSRHWSDAYQVFPTQDGAMMVTPAPDFDNQLAWLIEEDVHEDLLDEKYAEPENLRERILRTMDIMRRWVAGKESEDLFFEAQSRHAPYGWVLPPTKLVENPQLLARNWFQTYDIDGHKVSGPGMPYHFSATPWQLAPYASKGQGLDELLEALDWQNVTEKPGDAEPRKPLQGLRVLDFTHVLAGPFCTRTLADMGADVVKVHSDVRALGTNHPTHPYFLMWNRNKRALELDTSTEEGRDLCRQLCDRADIVIDNFSVGVLDRWGVGYAEVSRSNPGVSYIQMSGMGEGGPWSGFVTYAPTIHALCGLTYLTGVPGREDIGIGVSYNDHIAGLHAAVAILSCLEHRANSGHGQRVDMSQFEVGVNLAGPTLLDLFANGVAAEPVGNDLPYDSAVPHGCYRCAPVDAASTLEERWLAIACMTDEQWVALRTLMGNPDWASDPALDKVSGRQARKADIEAGLSGWLADQDAYEAMARCQAAGVPAGVVQDAEDMVTRDPQFAASGYLHKIDDVAPNLGQTWADKLPLKFQGTPCDEYRRVRELGEDTEAVLADWLKE